MLFGVTRRLEVTDNAPFRGVITCVGRFRPLLPAISDRWGNTGCSEMFLVDRYRSALWTVDVERDFSTFPCHSERSEESRFAFSKEMVRWRSA